jgi:tetratricopeptide (TPR) repeat protein
LVGEARAEVDAAELLMERVEASDPLWEEYRIGRALADFESGDHEKATALLVEAFRSSLRHGRDGSAVRAARLLAYVISETTATGFEEARAYGRIAQDLALQRGDIASALVSEARLTRVELAAGEYDAALEVAESALERHLARENPDPVFLADLLSDKATALGFLGRLDEAESTYRRALASAVGVVGPQHPVVARIRVELGAALGARGEFEQALEELRGARSSFSRVYGEEHLDTIMASLSIGVCLLGQRRFAEAERVLRAQLELRFVSGSPADRLRARRNLGAALVGLGEYDAAVREVKAAIERAKLDPADPDVLLSLEVVAAAHAGAERWEDAERAYAELVGSWAQMYPPEHPTLLRARLEHEALMWQTGTHSLDEAEQRILEVVAAIQKNFGEQQGVALRGMLLQAELTAARGDSVAAEALFARAIEAAPADSVSEAECVLQLVGHYSESGQYEAVLQQLSEQRVSSMRGRTQIEALMQRGVALWEVRRAHEDARALMTRAAELLAQRPGSFPTLSARVQSWLDTHGAGSSD